MWLRLGSALSLVGAPLWAIQGRWVRANTPLLPEAGGPRQGQLPFTAAGPAERILMVGESPAAGVGARHHRESLVGCFAARWGALRERTIDWQVVARNGMTAARTRRELLPDVPRRRTDVIVIVLGVNDTMRLTPVPIWRAQMTGLFDDLRERCGPAPIVVSAVPPMQRFPALPSPLREVLGLRARLLDQHLQEICTGGDNLVHIGGLIEGISDEMFCEDRFHPGPEGYEAWGGRLADAAFEMLFG
ncbi:MAG: SGNH/GDSL hydrolase family protein [Myxococcota bacterium]